MSTSDIIKIQKIIINSEECISCGNCSVLSPKVFELGGEDSKAKIVDNATFTDDNLIQTAQMCPVRAIQLYDSNGNLIELD